MRSAVLLCCAVAAAAATVDRAKILSKQPPFPLDKVHVNHTKHRTVSAAVVGTVCAGSCVCVCVRFTGVCLCQGDTSSMFRIVDRMLSDPVLDQFAVENAYSRVFTRNDGSICEVRP